ncbi:MAG: tetratricopeptide repeat protein [candidate division NC10 bacterium]|nr:tetratricopeptide repeat protein [candidate division NC10 bacterium]
MTRKRWMAAAWGLAILVAWTLGGGYEGRAEERHEAATVADQFLRAVREGDSAGAFELSSSALRRGKTAEDFLRSPEIATPFSGMKSWETVRVVERGSMATAVVKLAGEEGGVRVRAIGIGCLKMSGGYRVRDFSLTPWVSSEARFFRSLADLYDRLEDLDLAEQEIKKAYALDPKDPKVSAFLGYIYLERKVNLEEAERLIQAAHEQDPDDPEFMDFLGWAHHIGNRRQDSVTWFDRAREAFQKREGYQSSPEYIRFSAHVDKAKAKGWRPTQT